jgi:branched-chain amino acid transport system ATP-binding protein
MVEHNLKAVADLSTKVSVLVRGAIIAQGTYAQMEEDRLVQQAYLGHPSLSSQFSEQRHD